MTELQDLHPLSPQVISKQATINIGNTILITLHLIARHDRPRRSRQIDGRQGHLGRPDSPIQERTRT